MPVNSDECMLTRMQEISLDYHITLEQEVGSSTQAFFVFNDMFDLFPKCYMIRYYEIILKTWKSYDHDHLINCEKLQEETGGIWRIKAINAAGGWNNRTTVEDMDLAVRAGLKGWKFLYLGDLQVNIELPSTFKAFRFQQHRWSCTDHLNKLTVSFLKII